MPSWRLLPSMLAERSRHDSGRARLPRSFLRDVRWGQYCLYLFTRFQDDLFDGQSDSPVSIYASDQCLFEAERVFSLYFPKNAWFWGVYRDSLRLTTRSIVEVDRLQQRASGRPGQLLEGYARVGEILKVGSAAVCAKMNQRAAFHRVSLFCDEMAKAGQILDDLQDLAEDLKRQRHNYVATVIRSLRKHGEHGGGKQQAFFEGLLSLAACEHVFAQARKHLSNASTVITKLALPGMNEYLDEYGKALLKAETRPLRRRNQRRS